MSQESSIALKRRARWCSVLAIAAAFSFVVATPATAKGDHEKFDRKLRERLSTNDDSPKKVIITIRPGARRGLLQRLRAQGVTVNREHNIIEAVSTNLRPSLLRRLATDRDVISISTDADVFSDGITSVVTEPALNEAYSLRSTLGLRRPSTTASTKTFRLGDANGYASGITARVQSSTPATSIGAEAHVAVEDEGLLGNRNGMLIRFDDLFGSAANQIPYGSTITSVKLSVHQHNDSSSLASASLYRMLVGWDAGATWASMTTSGMGIQRDNVEALSSADATVSNLAASGDREFSGSGLTAAAQAWAEGAANNGWILWQNSNDAWTVGSSENATVAYRPLLTVTYKPPVATTTLTGAGVTVAVIDSGLFQDGGGSTRIKTTRDFTTGNSSPASRSPIDGYGHGTHVAGLIGSDKAEVKGVAPGVKFVSLRVLNDSGSGSTSSVIDAIQWAVNNRATYGIDVMNLSLGHPIYEPAATDPLVQAVEAAVRAGIVVVVSAGNVGTKADGTVGYAGITSPANAPSAITVGAAKTFDTTRRTDDLIADYSSRGPTWYDAYAKPDVIAPGHRMLAAATPDEFLYVTYPTLRGPSLGGRAYIRLSGTSMAAGVVSGTVALMIESAKTQLRH